MREMLVTRKGQVTIPLEYRKKYGIKEGMKVLIEEGDGCLILRPIPKLEEQAGVDVGKYDVKELKAMLDRMREEWR